MVIKTVQTTFSAGEISEESLNRIDLDFYQKSLKRAYNVYINSTGNAVKREGSVMVAGGVDYVRLEGFSFNGIQDYIFAFRDKAVDVYDNTGLVAQITIPHTLQQIKELDYAQQADTVLLFHRDVACTKLLRRSSSKWEVSTVHFKNIPTYAYGEITDSVKNATLKYTTTSKKTKIELGSEIADASWVGQKIYLNKGGALDIYKFDSKKVLWGNWRVSPPDTADVGANEWKLSSGYETIFKPYNSRSWKHPLTGEYVFTMEAEPTVNDYVYHDEMLNYEKRRIVEGLTGDNDDTIYTQSKYTRDSSLDIKNSQGIVRKGWKNENETVFTHPDVVEGGYVYTESRENVLGVVTAFTTNELTVRVEYTREPSKDYTGGSNPSTGCFGKGRLYIGGIKGFESAVIASVVDDVFNLDIGYGEDSDGVLYKLDTFNPIKHLSFSQTLIVNTSNSEHFLEYTSSGVVTPKTFNIVQSSTHGTSVKPFDIDGITAFIERSGCIVRSFVYDDVQRNYNAENLSVLCPHLIKNVTRVAVRKSSDFNPNNVAYLLNDDGTITLFNLLREQKFRAFSRCETKGSYVDVCSVNDKVYCLCDRKVGDKTVRFLERFSQDCELDCSVRLQSDERVTEWDGLDLFNGEQMDVVGDKYFYSGVFTPVDGAITGVVGLQGKKTDSLGEGDGFTTIEVGYGYIVDVTPAPIEFKKYNDITSFSDVKRLVYVNSKCIDTLGIMIKCLGKTYKANYLRTGPNTLNDKLNLETGFKKVYCGGYSSELVVTITQEFPAKFNLVALDIGVE